MLKFLVALAFLLIFATACGIFVAACGGPPSGGSKDAPNGSVVGSVQTIVVGGQTRKYVCFTYTTTDRGGLWCERIVP